ncbi:uncharacterized protein ACLA_011390 [Aspergillus clavatus NRRL 1]|uniref:Uncharacterized protein n=1 Tax=Aspergillus clavatus (strain ATCC 1007 / CBS 513.65 / DSM 816 / NCTC 3887 / NRRL 1 / QM 1276 / 107) TaxID=344612 RepID=A1CAE4_ASPCL|nr:uncharacterized protein ACLA_011390 [Aspergillus clavatus NRRL 1]EAW12712.1 conserved hypothetical protein [Aspergillus clavatus NRRL 1]
MRFFSALFVAGAATAANNSYCTPSSGDVQVVQLTWALEYLIEQFYSSTPLNQTFLNSAVNSSNANYYTNLQGMQRQNRLGVRAVQQLGNRVENFDSPKCNFTFETPSDSESFLQTALQLEQSVSGALIGLEGYTQAPEVSFLLARLAVQHGAHSGYLATTQEGVVFPNNATSLTPAYSPDYVLTSGQNPGQLGDYINGCVSAPQPPCGNLTIGPLIGSLGGSNSTTSSSAAASSTGAGAGSSSDASATSTATATGSSKKRFF